MCPQNSQVQPTVTADVTAKFRRATDLHKRGQLAQAEVLYREVLRAVPAHAEALHLLGAIALQAGQASAGVDLMKKSIAIEPRQSFVHANLGRALLAAQRPDEALISFDHALRLKPDFVEVMIFRGNVLLDLKRPEAALDSFNAALAHKSDSLDALNNGGTALRDLRRFEQALAYFDRALRIKPDFAEAHINRGNVLADLKRHDDALRSFDRALQIKPDLAEAYYGRGNTLRDSRRLHEALASYDQVVALKPDFFDAYNDRGNVLLRLKRHAEALTSFDQALRLAPEAAITLNNRGAALLQLKRPQEAMISLDRALQLKPDLAEAWNNRGNVLREMKHSEESLACFERALQLQPRFTEALSNRGGALYKLRRYRETAECLESLVEIAPDYEYALGNMFHARLQICDWGNYALSVDRIADAVQNDRYADSPGSFISVSESPEEQLRCARLFVADKFPQAPTAVWRGERYRHDRIRVAYLSADFHDHPVAHLTAGLFERHDRQCFETIGISTSKESRPSAMRERLRSAFEQFHEGADASDHDVASLLRSLEVDIAVDMTGHTAGGRPGILAHRAAPIQVNFLGYPGTLGADYVDYIIADRTVIPAEHSAYAECIVRLPDCYMPRDDRQNIAEAPSRAEAGLPANGFVFCAFNNSFKITPRMFDIWMRLLRSIPDSVLWLRDVNRDATQNLKREAVARGIEPERLVFAPRVDAIEQHLARQRLADLFLDTLPYNAHTTASDALRAGLPVITCLGSAFAGRVAASLLHAIGLHELVAQSLEEYEALAHKLATAPDMLAGVRAQLVRTETTRALFDTDRFRRHLESAYKTMWERQRRGEPPANLTVNACEP